MARKPAGTLGLKTAGQKLATKRAEGASSTRTTNSRNAALRTTSGARATHLASATTRVTHSASATTRVTRATRAVSLEASEPVGRRQLKVPEALPIEKKSAFEKLKTAVFRKKPAIQEIVREPTSGGIVFRLSKDQKDIEVLLIQDSKGRWTIPKGHIEVGETAKMTARREIEEETGLKNFSIKTWLGKIHFKYRRADKLVLMTTQIYLVQALDSHETPTPEKWMKGIAWFPFAEALDMVEYDDIEKLMLIAKKKVRTGEY